MKRNISANLPGGETHARPRRRRETDFSYAVYQKDAIGGGRAKNEDAL